MKRAVFLGLLLFMTAGVYGQGTGYVRLEGRQFKDENGDDFYPLIINYNLGRTTSVDANGNTYFYVSPASSYGESSDFECNDQSSCNNQFLAHFSKITSMGFNTIRIDLSVTYRSSVPVTNNSRHFTVFYDENMSNTGSGNQWISHPHPYDLDMGSGFTDQNSVTHFNIILNILNVAYTAGLKVILVTGQSFKDTISPFNRIMWQTYDTQAASDFAVYLTKLSSLLANHPALLAYDFINEPIYQEMYRNGNNNFVTKDIICSYVTQWYDAVRVNDNNHLITIGSGVLDELFFFDPAVMKLDFYSAHLYTKGYPLHYRYTEPTDHGVLNGFDRYKIINYWMSSVYPMPWIMGETGFSADDNTAPFPRFHPDPVYHNPPWMFGSEAQQHDFAEMSLEVTRNALASGYAWWAFQNVYWFNLNNQPHEYTEDFFGLLYYGTSTNPLPEKPATAAFENYLDINGLPPPFVPLAQPANYYDPYEIASNCSSCLSSAVDGMVYDQKGYGIKNAVIIGTSWVKTIDAFYSPTPWIATPLDPYDDKFEYDVPYTFSHSDNSFAPKGYFKVVPYNYNPAAGTSNPHRIINIKITAAGAETKCLGNCGWIYPGGFGDQPMTPQYTGNVTLKKIVNSYDAFASNETVASTETRNYYGRNTLTVSNLFLYGKSNLTAKSEVQINTEFHANAGNLQGNAETHIFISDAFPDCSADFGGYSRYMNETPAIVSDTESLLRNIEMQFNLAEGFLTGINPNPSNGTYQIYLKNRLVEKTNITVFNLLGENVYSHESNEPEVFMQNHFLPTGMYIVAISNGGYTLYRKIIINK